MFKIGVVFGGTSDEHEVSLAGAMSVLKAFKSIEGVKAQPIGIGKDGRWHVGSGALEYLIEHADKDKLFIRNTKDVEIGGPLDHHHNPPFDYIQGCDYILPIIHGRTSEDGVLQGFFETLGLDIIGCGILSSAACFDKAFLKEFLSGCGYKVSPGVKQEIESTGMQDTQVLYKDICAELGTNKLVIKPNDNGSSIGLSQAENAQEFKEALMVAGKVTDQVVIEKYIKHREIVVGVIGQGDDILISDLGESNISTGKVYYYEDKYNAGSVCKTPAQLEPKLEEKIRKYTKEIYTLLECTGWARIDFFVELETNDIYVNEINTIPGMSEPSVFPQIFKSKGYDYPTLIEMILEKAIQGNVAESSEPNVVNA